MDYAGVFALSAAGMGVERTRLEVAAMNLANAHSAQHPAAAGYQPLRVVSQLAPASFAGLVEAEGVLPAASIEAAPVAVRLVQEPGHPLANEQGFVAYPGVDPAAEMVSLMTALRSYEANVVALNTARALALKTLEIGRGS
jgi:flagellar basal-body rod protein FlgC